jgi:uncharacterized membrane protein
MKELKIRIAIGLLILILVYLFTSFIKLSFNPFLWGEITRFGCALLGTVLAVFVALILDNFEE